jgi:hypothetical protein
MVEIYNEQVRDLLSSDGPHKRYPSCLFFSILLFVLGYIFHDWRFNSIAFLDWFCDPFWFFFDLWMQILAFWSFFCWLVQSFSVKIFVSLLTAHTWDLEHNPTKWFGCPWCQHACGYINCRCVRINEHWLNEPCSGCYSSKWKK